MDLNVDQWDHHQTEYILRVVMAPESARIHLVVGEAYNFLCMFLLFPL